MKTTPTHVYFFSRKDEFSNFFPARFMDANGNVFHNTEQAFMYQKAKFFGDAGTMMMILNEADPGQVKKYGRMVKNFDNERWDEARISSMEYVNIMKYRQNPDLGLLLKSTGTRVLVEASPYDKIWGVGLGQDDDAILNESNWTGLNLLGKVLMNVRTLI